METVENQNTKFKPTINWMEDNYTRANQELFGGLLGGCDFRVEKLNSKTLGQFRMSSYAGKLRANGYTRRMYVESFSNITYIDRKNFVDLCQPTIVLNSLYTATQDAWYNTLVHEMCHYYTYMNGRCPKQAHGVEFREVAYWVSRQSNGEISVQRLASAEEMNNYDLDAEVKEKMEKRKAAKKNNAHYYLIVLQNEVRLINTKDEKIVDFWVNWTAKHNGKIFEVVGEEAKEWLFDHGYKTSMRSTSYWSVTLDMEGVRLALQDNGVREIEQLSINPNKINQNMDNINENIMKGMRNKSTDVELTPDMNLGLKSPIEEGMEEPKQGLNTIRKIQDLVNATNNIYHKNLEAGYGDMCLMDKEGNLYDLAQDIRLDGNGYVTFSFKRWSSKQPEIVKCKVLTKKGGKVKLYRDELGYDDDWNVARKLFKQISDDAARFIKDMEGYDPNWEDGSKEGADNINQFNKSIGLKENKIDKIVKESVKKVLKRN